MNSAPLKTAAAAAVVLLVAASAHFLYFARAKDFFYPDSFTYLTPARYLVKGMGFVFDEDVAETIRTPGYPLILAGAIRAKVTAQGVVAGQHLLSILVALGAYIWAFVATRSRPVALMAGLISGTDLLSVHYANKILTETVFTAGLFIVVLMALRTLRSAEDAPFIAPLLGLLCGGLVLVRPAALLYSVVLAVVFLFCLPKARVRITTVFLICALVLPATWAFRNYDRTGVFVVSSLEGTNLLMFRAAGALAMEEQGGFREAMAVHQAALLERANTILRSRYGIDPDDLPHAVASRVYTEVAESVIAHHPAAYARLVLRGIGHNLFESDWQAVGVVSSFSADVLKPIFDGWNALIVLISAAGLISLWKRDREAGVLLLLTIGYFIVIAAGGESEGRFRTPVIPEIAFAAAVGMGAVTRHVAALSLRVLPKSFRNPRELPVS